MSIAGQWPGELHDRHTSDVGQFGMRHRVLLAGSDTDLLAKHGKITCFVGGDLEAERGSIDDGIDHASVGDVDRQCPVTGNLQRCIEGEDEGRDVLQGDRNTLAVAALGDDVNRAGGHVESEPGLRLDHRDHTGLEQDGGDAHRVAARHRGVFGRLHHDCAGRAIVACRRHDQVDVACHGTARLADQHAADVVVVALERHLFGHHRVAWRRQDSPGDHVALLALGVAADDRNDPFGHHQICPRVDQCC